MNYRTYRGCPASIFMLLLACLLSGCGDSNRNKIIGDWRIAPADKLLSRVDGSETAEIAGDASPMVIHFFQNGNLETEVNSGRLSSRKEGRWQWVAFDPETNSAKISCRLMDQTTEHEVEFEGSDAIRMVPPNLAGLSTKVRLVRE